MPDDADNVTKRQTARHRTNSQQQHQLVTQSTTPTTACQTTTTDINPSTSPNISHAVSCRTSAVSQLQPLCAAVQPSTPTDRQHQHHQPTPTSLLDVSLSSSSSSSVVSLSPVINVNADNNSCCCPMTPSSYRRRTPYNRQQPVRPADRPTA